MAEADNEKLIRQYATGEITWSALRTRGFDSYLDVLAELGKLGLRPPVAPMEGPNVEARQRERASLEVLRHKTAADPELQAMLLFEDSDIRRRRFVLLLPERVTAISTGDFLHELEAAGRIQSADHILDEAAARGRNVEQQRQP